MSSASLAPVWVEIDGTVPVILYRDQAVRPSLPPGLRFPLLSRVGTLIRPLSAPGIARAETASVTIDLDNAAGALSKRYKLAPPVRCAARIRSTEGVSFEGVITEFSLGNSAALTIESGIRLPLTDTVPLRSSVVWGGYKEVRALPIAYGRVRITPVPYDASGKLFVLADHSIAGVDKVTRDEAPTAAWAFYNGVDSTGKAVAYLELASALASGEALAVWIRGKRHAGTGKLLTSPAEIIYDLLSDVCGLPIAWSRFDKLRAQTSGLSIGGAITDPQKSIRTTIDDIVASVGAAWSAGADDFAMLYPWPAAGEPSSVTANALTASDMLSKATHSEIVTVLRIAYDYDYHLGKARRALALECPEAIRKYGRIEQDISAGWLRSPRDAQALGERLLAWMARPRYSVSWKQSMTGAKPGDFAAIDHPGCPLSGSFRLLAVDLNLDDRQMFCRVESPVGEIPAIVTKTLSTTFEPVLASGASVEYVNGQAFLTLLDDTGQPITGASVTLDGKTTRFTDSHGRVSFIAGRGGHAVHVEASGYAPMDIQVVF